LESEKGFPCLQGNKDLLNEFFLSSFFLFVLSFSPLFCEPQNKKIGLVIAAFDRPQFLERPLKSLKQNSFGHENL